MQELTVTPSVTTLDAAFPAGSSDQSEQRFRFLFDSNVLPIAFWNINGEVYDANEAFLNLLGFTKKEMLEGKVNWKQFTLPEDAFIHDEKVKQALAGKSIAPYETTYVDKNGNPFSALVGYAMLTGSREKGIAFMHDISKLKEANAALRKSEEQYRQLSGNLEELVKERTRELNNKNKELSEAQQIAQLGSWEWNMKNNEVLWSDEMYRIYGYGDERFPVRIEKATERMMPGDFENIRERVKFQVEEAISSFKQNGSLVHNNRPFEYTIVLPGGEKRILRGIGKVILTQEGSVSRIIGTVQDITEQKRSEEKIIAINKQLVEAQQIAQIGNWEWDVTTGKLSWSANMHQIFGLDPSEAISFEKFSLLVHPEDRSETSRHIEDALQIKKFEDFFHRIVTPAGQVKILHARGEVIVDSQGNVVKMIGTAQDVTNAKLTEQELIEANIKLEERNLFVEKLINSSLDLIVVVDKNFNLITVNKKAESVIQSYYSGALAGKKITDINPLLKKKSQAYEDLLRAFKGEIVVRDKVKDVFSENYYEHNYVPLLNASAQVYAVMIISHDITENIKQLEELKKLNEADKLKSDFMKMASHELKTPVTSIKGYTQLLLTALKDKKDTLPPLMIKSSLISIDKQVARLTRLMSELLDLSKIETGMLVLNKELFSLNELVIETVQDILYTNSKHAINIFHDLGCMVYCDKDRIGQVLINLLTNAIKYSPNSDKIEVWIAQSGKDHVSVTVKDYGIGIDAKDREKIFERFYRAQGKEEQTYPGFGIGLFIAKEIIQRHEGTIHMESERGNGSAFTFILPVATNNK